MTDAQASPAEGEERGEPGAVEYVPVDNALAGKVREIKDVSPRALYQRASATAEASVRELEHGLRDQVAALSNQYRAVAARPGDNAGELRALADHAFEVKGLGGSIGYPLISQIGEALYRLARRLSCAEGRTLEVVGDMVGGIEMVMTEKLAGDGGERGKALVGEISAGLREVIAQRR